MTRRLAGSLALHALLLAQLAAAQSAPAPSQAAAKPPQPPAASAPADADRPVTDVGVLLDSFARMPGLEARFVEEKHIALLARPLESKGRLYFARPGMLLRRVEEPTASEIVITPSQLKMKDGNGEQSIDLRARADLRPFVESLVWLLAGNREALSSVYGFAFEPAGAGKTWRLRLTPKAGPISKLIQYIQVVGTGLAVARVEVRELSGDETITRIVEANPSRRFTPSELQSFFGISGGGQH
jgi:outer membrane lipoprotein-sorting protein